MKKVICMIALAAISYGTVFAAVPVKVKASVSDTVKIKKKVKNGKVKMKVKKDTTMVKPM